MNKIPGVFPPLGISSSLRRYTAPWRTSRTFSAALRFAGSIAALLFCPVAWSVTVIPDAHYEIAVGNPGANGDSPAVLYLPLGRLDSDYCTISGGVQIGCQSATALMFYDFMSVSGSMTGPSPAYISTASAIAQYYYAVIGPANISVNMGINGIIGTSVSGGDVGGTQTSVTGLIAYTILDGGSAMSVHACSTLAVGFVGCTQYPTLAVLDNTPYTVMANTLQQVSSRLDGSAANSINGSSYSGTIDPIVNFDPAWLVDNPGYSLVFSANFATVPIPPAVWLFGSALGVMGVMRRKISS